MNKTPISVNNLLVAALISAIACLTPLSGVAHPVVDINAKGSNSLAPMLKDATPAVVNITVEKEIAPNPNSETPEEMAAPSVKAIAVGSGVIINAEKGYIVTNAHIVKNQKVMIVTLKDGRRYHAKLIGTTDGYDIAVLQVQAKNLAALPFGNSGELKVGDFVVAVGSPFGLSQTVTSGVISALNRATPKIEGFQNFIQTDAPINPGNSGGALIDTSGRFIGMNTAILAPGAGNIGIGFAIPSNMVKSVADQLITYGKIIPGLLGVIAQNITPELADAMKLKDTNGVLITQVMPSSPAETAGIKSEDVILKVDNDPIASSAQLHNLMGITHPGTKLTLLVLRDGKQETIKVVAADPNSKVKQRILPYLTGLRLQDFSDLEPDNTAIKGAMVLSVDDTSAGALAGLIPGDVIISANKQPVDSVHELVRIATHAPNQLLMKVIRGPNNLFLVIQPDQ